MFSMSVSTWIHQIHVLYKDTANSVRGGANNDKITNNKQKKLSGRWTTQQETKNEEEKGACAVATYNSF